MHPMLEFFEGMLRLFDIMKEVVLDASGRKTKVVLCAKENGVRAKVKSLGNLLHFMSTLPLDFSSQ